MNGEHSLPTSYRPGPEPQAPAAPMPMPWAYAPPPGDGLADTLRKLRRRKWILIGCPVVALIAAGLFAVTATPLYTGEAQLRVGVPQAKVTTNNMQAVIDDPTIDAAGVQSETYALQSRDLAGRVVDRLGLDQLPEFNPALRQPSFFDEFGPKHLLHLLIKAFTPEEPASARKPVAQENPDRERAINVLLSRIDIQPLGRSHVIEIDAHSADPELAAKIANTMAKTYIEDQLVQKAAMTERAGQWLMEHIRKLRDQVEKDERAVVEYRRKHGLYQTKSDTVTAQQLGELNTQLILAQANKATADAQLKQAMAQSKKAEGGGGNLPEVLSSPLIQALQQQLATARQQVAQLSVTYGKRHPQMQHAEAQLRDIKAKIHAEVQKIIAGLQIAAQTANARYQALKQNLDTIKNEVGKDSQYNIALSALEREADASRALFQQILERSKETSAQQDMQQPDAQLISHAAIPMKPSFPPTDMLLAVALVGGVVVGILLVLVIEQLDGTFRTEDQVEEQTGLPILAVVPKTRKRRLTSDFILKHPTSAYSEAMRMLEIRLRLSDAEKSSKVLMLSSAAPNEGKSGICLSLARMAAARGLNVIVIDCDWRRPQLHAMVHRPNRVGLGELLTGRVLPDDVVYRDFSGAHMIFAGRLKPRHTHLLYSDRMRYLLNTLARHYDLVFVDTPPVTVGAEVLHLASLVDKTIYVVRWGHTPRDLVLKGLRQLASSGAPIAGAVLSQVDSRRYRRYARTSSESYYRAPTPGRAA